MLIYKDKMNLVLLLCLSLVFHCTAGQMEHDFTLSNVLIELKKLQKTQEECTIKFSELDDYKFRVLSLEYTVKDLQDTVKDLQRENKELVSEIHRLEDDRRQTSELNVNNYEPTTQRAVEVLQNMDDRQDLNTTYPLQENADKPMTRDENRIRSAIKRSFTVRPTPTYPVPPNPGHVVDSHVAFTVALSPREVKLNVHSTVIFDKVFTNIGSAYQPNTGIFTAPLKGAYVFFLTMEVSPGQYSYLHFVKDGSNVNSIFADSRSKNDYTSTTQEWILEVNKGSEVWIRSGTHSQLHGALHSMLSGYLLFETN